MIDKIIENRCQVIGIGDALVDLFTHASQLPTKGGNIWSTAVTLSPGGTAANVSANIAKLGISSAFIGCIGDDPYGRYMVDEFVKIGVNTFGIIIQPGAYTGIVLGIIADDGERTFIACAKGAAHTLFSREFVQNIKFNKDQAIQVSGVCLVEEPSRSGLLLALSSAHNNGNKIFFDPNLRLEGDNFTKELREAQWQAIALSGVVLIGDEELRLLCKSSSLLTGADLILNQGPELVVVKQGEKGASVFSKQGEVFSPAFKVDICSTAGAGDSFDAGFIAAQIRGANFSDSLAYANAVAAIKVTRLGSRSVPSDEEVMIFLAEKSIQIHLSPIG
jgi:sugar/nucleoside kinase (ribokinase family)